jgi:hypothetical protein
MTYIPRRGHSRTAATPGDTVLNLLSWSAQTSHNSATLLIEDTQFFANYRKGNFKMFCGVQYIVCLQCHLTVLNTEAETLRPLMRPEMYPITRLGLLVEVQLHCLSTFSTTLMWKVSVMARPH